MARPLLLPLELIDMIFAWARLEPRKGTADLGTLAASCLVCRAWQAPAQALLFRDIPISLCHRRRSLLIQSLSDRPDLGRHIRSFGMEISNFPVSWGRDTVPKACSKRYRRMISEFIRILTRAPNLTRLIVDIDGEFDDAHVSDLLSIDLCHLEILNWEGRPTSSALYLLLALWPSIRHLRIDNLGFDPLPEDRRPLSFRGLCMRDDLSEGFMRWLLPKEDDDEPLRELHIESSLSFRALKDVQPYAYTLHVLTVDRIPPQSFLDALIVLKELTFCELPSSAFDLPRSLLRVIYHAKGQQRHQLTNADGHHTVTREEGDEPKSADEARFLVKALKELPHLSSFSATRQTPAKVLDSLHKFCREAGVDFFVCDSTAVYSVSFFPWTSLYKFFDLFYEALAQSDMTGFALLLP
jgi:hypothetical protein